MLHFVNISQNDSFITYVGTSSVLSSFLGTLLLSAITVCFIANGGVIFDDKICIYSIKYYNRCQTLMR